MKQKIYGIGALVLLLFIGGCTSEQQQVPVAEQKMKPSLTTADVPETSKSSDVYQVVIEQDYYKPATIEIKKGQTVEWVNKDNISHTVSFVDSRYGETDEIIPPEGTFMYTFETEGFYTYYSLLSEKGMVGEVVVK